MKKRLITIPFLLVLLLNFASLLSASAYTISSSFYNKYLSSPTSFTFLSDGVLLIHSFFYTTIDVSILPPSERNLDLTYFDSGTWQGRSVSDLSSSRLCDQSDTVGFSQTVSLSHNGNYYIYSVLTCLPCVSGDSFSLTRARSPHVVDYSRFSYVSQLYGVTGVKKVYTDSSQFFSDETISYTTKSDNQFLVFLFTPDKFYSENHLTSSNPDYIGSDISNLTRISSSTWGTVYTSNYGIDKGVDLSLKLQDGFNAWNFTVYELYTDGKYYPGYDDGSVDDDSGSSDSSADFSKIEQYLRDIIEILKAGAAPPDPHEFWEVYREGLIELFGFQSSEPEEPAEPPPEESEGEDSSEPDSPSFEIDEEQFESAMEYVNIEDLGESISGPTGAISFFWHFADRFFTSLDLYPVIALSLIFCLVTWLIRS